MILLTLLACRNGWGGVSVGNPGLIASDLAPTTGQNYRRVRSMSGTMDLLDCDGDLQRVLDDGELLGSVGDHHPGTWCGLVIEPSSTMLISGTDFDAELVVPTLKVTGTWDVDGDSLVLRLGSPDWLSGAQGAIDSAHPDHDAYVDELRLASTLHYDDDEDGEVDDDENEIGHGEDDEDGEED